MLGWVNEGELEMKWIWIWIWLPAAERRRGEMLPRLSGRWRGTVITIVIDFMNSQTTVHNTQQILLDFRRELRLAERLHLQRTGATVNAVANFDRWMQSHYSLVLTRATELVIVGWAGVMASTWSSQTNTPQGAAVVQTITLALSTRRHASTEWYHVNAVLCRGESSPT